MIISIIVLKYRNAVDTEHIDTRDVDWTKMKYALTIIYKL